MVNENVRLENVFIGRGSFRNFSGEVTENNKSGARKFTIMLPEDLAAMLEETGWNIRHRPPYREGDDEQHLLDIFLGYDRMPPTVTLISYDGVKTYLNESTVGILDTTDIADATLEIRPYNWEVNGKTGCKAYLQELIVTAKPPRRAFNASLHQRDEDE